MGKSSLTIYRRHSRSIDGKSSCIKGYEQGQKIFGVVKYPNGLRVYEPHTTRETRQDCECPIVGDGCLLNETGRIRYRALKCSSWLQAKETAAQWLAWGRTKAPETEGEALSLESISIEAAVTRFSGYMDGWGWSDGYQRHFRILLNQRLIPWARKYNIVHMESLGDPQVATAFVHSWRNLNPTRNRLIKGRATADRRLRTTTVKNELTRFREFMRYALNEKWITSNPAPGIKMAKRKKRTAEDDSETQENVERYGLSEEEYGWIEGETRRWGNSSRALELQAIVSLLRCSGLRISDAATLDLSEIVERPSGAGHAIHLSMRKTRSLVYVPIPEDVYQLLMRVGVKGEKNGKAYLFWTGKGKAATCVKNFANDIAELMHRAQKPKDRTIKGSERNYEAQNYERPFQHRASTHSLRHTFATLALASGAPLQSVSSWLGHKSVKTTERFYIHACPELRIRSDQQYDQMIRRNQITRSAPGFALSFKSEQNLP